MRVVAYFDSLQRFQRAAHEAHAEGWRIVGACAPAFNERVLEAARATRSPVAVVALLGGIVGLLSGVLLTLGTVREWPGLIVSGKPLVSVPPILIISFELTILFASIATVWSFLVACAHARRAADEACDAATTDDRLSLLLELDGTYEAASDHLRRLGSTEWRRV